VSIFPQSHCVGVDASSSPNNCNASLLKEGCARVVALKFNLLLKLDMCCMLVFLDFVAPNTKLEVCFEED
jgi:hypothetical protein